MHLQNQAKQPKLRSWVYQRTVTISNSRLRCQPQSGTSSVLQSPNQDLKVIHVLGTFKNKIENIGVSKISINIQTNIDMPNSSGKPPASSKGQVKTHRTLMFLHLPSQDERQNSEHGYTKDQCSDNMNILIKIPNPIHKLFQPKANH